MYRCFPRYYCTYMYYSKTSVYYKLYVLQLFTVYSKLNPSVHHNTALSTNYNTQYLPVLSSYIHILSPTVLLILHNILFPDNSCTTVHIL